MGGKSADCFDKTGSVVTLPVASQLNLNHEGELSVANSPMIQLVICILNKFLIQ
jgi:hypothetical protein